MDVQRSAATLRADGFTTEVITYGYYLVLKNLTDLVALNRDLPVRAKMESPDSKLPDEVTGAPAEESPVKNPHMMLAYDIAALNALAADYAALHAEMLATGSSAVCAVIQQHGRQLKEFLVNLFPDRCEGPRRHSRRKPAAPVAA
jgi:hypothetical protein